MFVDVCLCRVYIPCLCLCVIVFPVEKNVYFPCYLPSWNGKFQFRCTIRPSFRRTHSNISSHFSLWVLRLLWRVNSFSAARQTPAKIPRIIRSNWKCMKVTEVFPELAADIRWHSGPAGRTNHTACACGCILSMPSNWIDDGLLIKRTETNSVGYNWQRNHSSDTPRTATEPTFNEHFTVVKAAVLSLDLSAQ